MENKKYSSYEAIDRDLEVFKLEREINYKKVLLNIDTVKEGIFPSKTVSKVSGFYNNVVSSAYGPILKIVIPLLVKWFINRKRGK